MLDICILSFSHNVFYPFQSKFVVSGCEVECGPCNLKVLSSIPRIGYQLWDFHWHECLYISEQAELREISISCKNLFLNRCKKDMFKLKILSIWTGPKFCCLVKGSCIFDTVMSLFLTERFSLKIKCCNSQLVLLFLAPLAVGQQAYVLVCCPSCIRPSVCVLTFSLNIFFSETAYLILMKCSCHSPLQNFLKEFDSFKNPGCLCNKTKKKNEIFENLHVRSHKA